MKLRNKRLNSLLAAIIIVLAACQTTSTDSSPVADKGKPLDPGYMHGVNISHYLSQLGSSFSFGDPSYVSEEDFRWIKNQGYDHIRLPVDGALLLNRDGSIREEMFPMVDRAIDWATGNGLNVLLDMHKLPGSSFSSNPDTRLFKEEAFQQIAIGLWKFIARRYNERGPELRFEILNEPVAEDADLVTALYVKVIKSIREISPDRVIHVCSNRWARIETIYALEPLLPDPNLVVDIHYYDPHIFTHQMASWVGSDHPEFPAIEFPGIVPDLSNVIDADHYGHQFIGKKLTGKDIESDFEELISWSRENNVRVYNGEFGAYHMAPPEARINWYKAVLNQCRKHGIGWAVWDYQGGFAIRDQQSGRTTLVHETIKPFLE